MGSPCQHCGTPTPSEEAAFCCTGCEFVHQLISDQNLDRYYDLKGIGVGAPVQDRPFQPLDLAWLDKAVADAETKNQSHLDLHVSGITCLGCVWLIEKLFLQEKGALRADIFPQHGSVTLRWKPGELDAVAFARKLQKFGYLLEPEGEERRPSSLAPRLGICGGLAMNAMAFSFPRYLGMEADFAFARLFDLILMASATFSLLIGGSYFITRAWNALKLKTLHIDLPISLGLIFAWAGSFIGWMTGHPELLYFDFVCIFTFLMLGGRYVHQLATERAVSQSRGGSPVPDTYALKSGASVPVRQIAPGQEILITPGSPVPVASVLRDQNATCSLAWINGEPHPLTFHPGQHLPSGAINIGATPLTAHAEEHWSDSLIARLTAPRAADLTSPLLSRILKIYLAAVLLIAAAAAIHFHPRLPGSDTLQIVISILVISCPCALGVAIPLTDQRASLALQQRGVFLRHPAVWERLPKIKRLLLDKTGTLTLQYPRLENPEALAQLSLPERAVLRDLTSSSLHPLSRSLHALVAATPDSDRPLDISEIPGQGLHAAPYFLGKPLQPQGATACQFRRNDHVLATFFFSESLRPGAVETFRALPALDVHILSGDEKSAVLRVGRELGFPDDNVHAPLDPDQKAELTQRLSDLPTLYLGDGANDALAFRSASLTGTPVNDRSLLERQADFFFTSRSLDFLPSLFHLGNWRSSTVRAVFLFAVVYNVVAIQRCLVGEMNPLLATILMPLSSLVTLLIASRSIGRTPRATVTVSS